MKIQVLGSGCATCKKLYELTQEAVSELKLTADVEYITDVERIIALGVMQSPVLAVDGRVVLAGYLPKLTAIKDALTAQSPGPCSCGGQC